ncbi:MAG: fatty acid desaturase [Pseudomonadota bacterium]
MSAARPVKTQATTMAELKSFAQKQRKGVCWRTLVFGTLAQVVIFTTTYFAVFGPIPLWVGFLVNSFWMVQGYTPAHEGVHKNIHGKDNRFHWLNYFYGVVNIGYGFHSYTMHEHNHRLHHLYANDRERDPEHFVARASSLAGGVLRCYLYYFTATWHGIKNAKYHPRPNRYRARITLELGVVFSVLTAICFVGYAIEALLLWVLPALNAWAFNAFRFIWLPHSVVRNELELIKVSRVLVTDKSFRGRVLAWLFNFHNYHEIHHLYPYVPWHALEKIYDRGKDTLAREGMRADPI